MQLVDNEEIIKLTFLVVGGGGGGGGGLISFRICRATTDREGLVSLETRSAQQST